MTTTDAVVAFDVTRNIVEHGSISTGENIVGNDAYRGRNGQYYSPFGVAQSVWNIPFFVGGRLAAKVVRSSAPDTIAKAVVVLGTAPAVGLLGWVCFALLRELNISRVRSLGTVLVLIFATPLWPYSGFGFNQPLAALFLWLGVWCAIAGVQQGCLTRWLGAGAALGVAVLTRHEMLLPAALVGGWIVATSGPQRRFASGWYAAGLLPGVATWGALNWWRFGNPLETGYLADSTPGFGSSVAAGAYGLLFSPYASLILYAPVVLLSIVALRALWRGEPRVASLFTALFVTTFVLYASLGNWMGGRSYGPRYLVPLLPALVLPLAWWHPSTRARRLAGALIIVSLAVQIPGVLVDYSKVRQERADAGDTVAQDMRWSGTPLFLNLQAVASRTPLTIGHLAGTVSPPRLRSNDPALSRSLSFGLDLWWLHAFYLGMVGARTAVVLGTGLAAAGAVALLYAARLARAGDAAS